MSQACKCDRCGKYFSESDRLEDFYGIIRYGTVGKWSPSGFYKTKENHKLDLCINCTNELRKWMRNV